MEANDEIVVFQESISSRNKQIEGFEKEIIQAHGQIDAHIKTISSRDARIRSLEAMNLGLDTLVAKSDTEIRDMESKYFRLEEGMAEAISRLQMRDLTIEDQGQLITNVEASTASFQAKQQGLSASMRGLERDLAGAESRVHVLSGDLEKSHKQAHTDSSRHTAQVEALQTFKQPDVRDGSTQRQSHQHRQRSSSPEESQAEEHGDRSHDFRSGSESNLRVSTSTLRPDQNKRLEIEPETTKIRTILDDRQFTGIIQDPEAQYGPISARVIERLQSDIREWDRLKPGWFDSDKRRCMAS